MGKTSRRAYEARKIRDRANRALNALERDVAAGVVSKGFAARREASLRELIRSNTYDRVSKSYGTSLSVARRQAVRVFDAYSASRDLSDVEGIGTRKRITPAREKALRNDLEAALRGELSLTKMEEAEAFLRSTASLWAGKAPEDRLDAIAKAIGQLEGGDASLIRAFRRWKRYTRDGEDFHEPSNASVYSKVEEILDKFKVPDPLEEAQDALAKKFD